jgi:pimeloyl-ACP methyl ester carboxylesterase/DNA-binding CsgD family transcriptional regulator
MLGEQHTVVRYDERGCGLSDRRATDHSLDAGVRDLETVVDAAGVDRFALLGISQGAAVAVAYAAAHPDRVSDLVLYGGYARGRRHRGQEDEHAAVLAAIRAGWDAEPATFRRIFSALFLPGGTAEQMAWYEELLTRSTSADTAARLFEARGEIDVCGVAAQVRTRTLVVHARDDRVVPVEEGRLLATLIPDARLLLLESQNHILLADERAWTYFAHELDAFLGPGPTAPSRPQLPGDLLSGRERDVVALVADGRTNDEIAEALFISPRTVERHLSNVYAKLGVTGKAARAATAARFSAATEPPATPR